MPAGAAILPLLPAMAARNGEALVIVERWPSSGEPKEGGAGEVATLAPVRIGGAAPLWPLLSETPEGKERIERVFRRRLSMSTPSDGCPVS